MSRRADGQLFVGRLSKNTRTRDLEGIFEPYGRLIRCEIKYGAEMAYAFVDYEDRRDAEDCVKYENGRDLCGSSIIVEWAKGNPRRPMRGGTGGNDQSMARRDSYKGYDECYKCHRIGHWARDCPEDRNYGYSRKTSRYSPSPKRRRRSSSPYHSRRRSRSPSPRRRRSRSRSRSPRRRRPSRSLSRSPSPRGAARRHSSSRSPRKNSTQKSRSKSGDKHSMSRSRSRSRSRSGCRSPFGANGNIDDRTKSRSQSRSRSRSRSQKSDAKGHGAGDEDMKVVDELLDD